MQFSLSTLQYANLPFKLLHCSALKLSRCYYDFVEGSCKAKQALSTFTRWTPSAPVSSSNLQPSRTPRICQSPALHSKLLRSSIWFSITTFGQAATKQWRKTNYVYGTKKIPSFQGTKLGINISHFSIVLSSQARSSAAIRFCGYSSFTRSNAWDAKLRLEFGQKGKTIAIWQVSWNRIQQTLLPCGLTNIRVFKLMFRAFSAYIEINIFVRYMVELAGLLSHQWLVHCQNLLKWCCRMMMKICIYRIHI